MLVRAFQLLECQMVRAADWITLPLPPVHCCSSAAVFFGLINTAAVRVESRSSRAPALSSPTYFNGCPNAIELISVSQISIGDVIWWLVLQPFNSQNSIMPTQNYTLHPRDSNLEK